MSNYMELPWNIEDTIENLKELRDSLKEKVILMNKDGRGEKDAEELDFDFNRAIDALEKQIPTKPKHEKYVARSTGRMHHMAYCANCNGRQRIALDDKFCRTCGHPIDWED